jgi:hypothetical protein
MNAPKRSPCGETTSRIFWRTVVRCPFWSRPTRRRSGGLVSFQTEKWIAWFDAQGSRMIANAYNGTFVSRLRLTVSVYGSILGEIHCDATSWQPQGRTTHRGWPAGRPTSDAIPRVSRVRAW